MNRPPSTTAPPNPTTMYPSPHRPLGPPGLTRYGSAPGSLLTTIADSVITESQFHHGIGSSESMMTRFFPGESPCLTSESTCKPPPPPPPPAATASGSPDLGGLRRSYGLNEIATAVAGDPKIIGSPLLRHSSSPAGFFSHLMVDNGFSVTRGSGQYPQPTSNGVHTMASTRLKSQLSFSRQEPLSQISEITIPDMGESVVGGNSSDETAGNVGQSYISTNYPISSWDDTNSIAFSAPSSKRLKGNNEDILTSLSHLDSQFSLPTTSLEMATVEKLFQAQQDSVPFKVRAKRGCATHPRSIAERERRTRISEKLRKLQELVPNMDKQTSTADMLDLAVQHIKELQDHVQNLNEERANCTCACKEEIP